MNKLIPRVLLISAFIFVISTTLEPILVNGQPSVSGYNKGIMDSTYAENYFEDRFEEEFFNGKSVLEDITFEDLEKLSDTELKKLGVNAEDEFNDKILDDDFDVEAAVDDLDISKMNEDEKETFLKVIEEAAAISGTEEVELLEKALIDIFDGDSETFNDLEATQEQLIDNYAKKLESEEIAIISKMKMMLLSSDKVYASKKKKGKIRVGVYLAGAVFNVAIGGVVGGGVSALKSYIKKKGKKAVAKTLSRVVTAKAKKLKIKTIRGQAVATVVGLAVMVALDYADVGVSISKFIDSRDWYRNNGWIDITK